MSFFLFLIGIVLALQLSTLPSPYFLIFLPLIFFLIWKEPKFKSIYFFSFGFLWVLLQGHYILSSSLPDALQGKDLFVSGVVSSIPDRNDNRIRFNLDIEQIIAEGTPIAVFPKKIRLSWYRYTKQIKAGEKWQLKVRLKKPHGMSNPGSFDYEKWLFERKIRATGYVKTSDSNRRIEKSNLVSVNVLRAYVKEQIISLMPKSDYLGIVLALTIGDKSKISEAQWKVFTSTGTNHLVAISGLHIGLVAGGMFLLAGFISKKIPRFYNRFPARKISAIVAILFAFFYAMLAGFAIPTQRALIMISVVMIFILFNQRLPARTILSVALVAVVLYDPFSMLSAGFWLSFIAVAAILFGMQNRFSTVSLWWKWGRLQWVVSVALIPPLLFLFQTFSIISPLANMIAVPWVSILIVPLVLVGALFSFLTPFASSVFWLVDLLLHWLWLILDYFSHMPFATWEQFSPAPWAIGLSSIGIILLLAPRGLPARYLAIFFLIPLFTAKSESPMENQFLLTLLDVGQGLSTTVQTKNHFLVFDTGPSFSSTFDTGKAVVLPYMRTLGVNKIDKLIISHADNDHAGGAQSILNTVSVNEVLTSVPHKYSEYTASNCLAGQQWKWDGVLFEILNPASSMQYGETKKSSNNRSCVLKISTGNKSVLIPGDIEKNAEAALVTKNRNKLPSNILIVPHHGSNTSSTPSFIASVNPDYALFPAGFRNRFNHPAKRVRDRYKKYNINTLNTARVGAIRFRIEQTKISKPLLFRDSTRRFWHSK